MTEKDLFITCGLGKVQEEQNWDRFVERFREQELVDSAKVECSSEKETKMMEVVCRTNWQRKIFEAGINTLVPELLSLFGMYKLL